MNIGRRVGLPAACVAVCLAVMTGCGKDNDAGKAPAPPEAPSATEPNLAPKVVSPGVHPRLLFTAEQLPAIRERARTEAGKDILYWMRRNAFEHRNLVFDKLKDPEWVATQRKAARGHLNNFAPMVRNAGLTAIIGQKQEDIDAALAMFGIWLSAWPDDASTIEHGSWGMPHYAIAYDCLYDHLSPAQRAKAVAIFAAQIGPKAVAALTDNWWQQGPSVNGRRTTNWTSIFGPNMGLTALAIDDTDGANPEMVRRAVLLTRHFLVNGITRDGAMYEGVQYPMYYGTQNLAQFLTALELRGVNLVTTTHLDKVPRWLTHELFPWGGSGHAYNKNDGNFMAGSFVTYMAQRFDGAAGWVYRNSTIAGEPGHGEMVLINGFVDRDAVAEPPANMPLTRWFSSRGIVFSRTGWTPRDAQLLTITNPVGAGHTNADNGSFCLASHGVLWVADGGTGSGLSYTTAEHNLVLVDSFGQANRESSLDGYTRSVEHTAAADVIDMDLRLAYSRVLDGGLKGPWSWREHNPMRQARRHVMMLRVEGKPVVVVSDRFVKDDQPHLYEWYLRTVRANRLTVDGRRFSILEPYGGPFVRTDRRGRKAAFVTGELPEGTYRGWLLVRGEPAPVRWTMTQDMRINGKAMYYADTRFGGSGGFARGWRWHALKLDRQADLPHKGGEFRLDIESHGPGQIAAMVVTRDLDWTPGFGVPEPSQKLTVVRAEAAQLGDPGWVLENDPRSRMDGIMLGAQPLEVHGEYSGVDGKPMLRAVRRDTAGRFLAVMMPYDVNDGSSMTVLPEADGHAVELRIGPSRVVIAGAVDRDAVKGPLETDAEVAAVVYNKEGALASLAMIGGTRLGAGQTQLVESDRPVQVVFDGRLLAVRGEASTQVRCSMVPERTRINGVETKVKPVDGSVALAVPALQKAWRHAISPDGRTVTVTGDGDPMALTVHAPRADTVIVNGVNRYFTRDRFGRVYPVLHEGTRLQQPRDTWLVWPADPLPEQNQAKEDDE